MTYASVADFEAEIESFRARLRTHGRIVDVDETREEHGIRCDFELPYSTLPELLGKRWIEKNP